MKYHDKLRSQKATGLKDGIHILFDFDPTINKLWKNHVLDGTVTEKEANSAPSGLRLISLGAGG